MMQRSTKKSNQEFIRSAGGDQHENPLSEHLTSLSDEMEEDNCDIIDVDQEESSHCSDLQFESRVQHEELMMGRNSPNMMINVSGVPLDTSEHALRPKRQHCSDAAITNKNNSISTPMMTPNDGSEIVKWQVTRHINSASYASGASDPS